MECNFCKGIGKLKVDEQIVICYACEGCKEIEACISCNGTGEKVFENKPIVVFRFKSFSLALAIIYPCYS